MKAPAAARVDNLGSMTDAVVPELKDPSLYFNRELSQLEFHRRVLEQAKDPATPLLERLRFLTICSSILDEFFEIRAAGVHQQVAYRVTQRGHDGRTPQEVLAQISTQAHRLVAEQYRVLNEVLLPAMEQEGIRLLKRRDWSPRQQRWMQRTFTEQVLPVLSPVGLDPAHPFPRILNKSLHFIVSVAGTDAFGRSSGIAVVAVPRSLPRVLALPPAAAEARHDFVLLSSIVHAHVGELFPGMTVTGCYQFRVTRNSDLWVDEEEVEDLLRALKGELRSRLYGDAVRLEVADDCPPEMNQYLLDNFELQPADLYQVHGPVNLNRLAAIYELTERPDLKYPRFLPGLPRRLEGQSDLFQVLRRGDLLLHHPYQSFAPVIDLLRQAAADPAVLAIQQTLYRTGVDSPVVEALLEAARNGKEVTAVVELRARFDEAANIDLATRLQEAGAKVVYGIVGYKAHAKALLIVRREGRRLRRYVHLGTGNYHSQTTRLYTDFSLLSCDRDLGEDVHKLFLQLTGLGRIARMKKLWYAPFTLRKALLQAIEREAEAARAGRPSGIRAKMNALTDAGVIQALYRAAQAGVAIDLVVRGVCCLRPGVPGVSDRIRVRSIVGRFLEHSRVFWFHNGGEPRVYCSSADWMERNFFRRVEACFPVEDEKLRDRVVRESLLASLADGAQSWILQRNGAYQRAKPSAHRPQPVQDLLLEELAG